MILCLFFTKTLKTLTSVCVGLSVLTRFKVNIFPREQAPGQNIHLASSSLARRHILREQKHRFAKKAAHGQIWFFSPKGDVFATMKAVFWNKTVLGFWTVQEHALRHKARRTGRRAEGHRLHEWGFYGFCLYQINFRKLNK